MESKRLALPDHQALSPRRNVVCGYGLWVGASLVTLSVFFVSNSYNGRIVTPFFQGFNTFTTSINSSSWPFLFSTSSTTKHGNVTTGAEEANSVIGVVLGNSIEDGENRKCNDEHASVLDETHESKYGNFSDLNRDDRVLETHHLGIFPGNISLSSNVDIDAKGSREGEFVTDITDVNNNNTIVENSSEGNTGISEEKEDGNERRNYFRNCDIFDGRWVRDDSKPYYPAGSCPYIDRDFDCHLNGRPDDGFVKWKWQPNGCDIASLNATDFLERLRGKKLVFVGDSLNRNMWESLVCILRHSIRNKNRVYEISGRTEFKKKGFYAFRFEDYNCTVDFVSSPFLVRESSFKSRNETIDTLRLDLMDTTTSMYYDADVIIFNTGHWWTHEKTSRGEDYYQEGNYVHPRLKVLEAYKRALGTWSRWIDKNIDSNRTLVFFRGYSVTHFRGGRWNSGGQCHKETEPIFNASYLGKYPSKMRALQPVLQEMKSPVIYLNISRLTAYRKDGHPSIYRREYKTTEEQIAAEGSQDCSHWCLPGVPDTWNELLYASLLKAGMGSWKN